MSFIISPRIEKTDQEYAAEMTKRQFMALQIKLDKPQIISELSSSNYLKSLQKPPSCNLARVRSYLLNGWNTEHILCETKRLLINDQLIYGLQWCFPQAYYSSFAIIQAFMNAIGQRDISNHSTLMKSFGNFVYQHKYPSPVSFLATGGLPAISFINISKQSFPTTLYLDQQNPASIDTQICQFLKSTRELCLKERKKSSTDIRNKIGKIKKSYSPSDWDSVSNKIGYTTVLHLLYRKRIKSNYEDIETYLQDNIDAATIYDNLIHIVSCLNFIHEVYIAKCIGLSNFKEISNLSPVKDYLFLKDRLDLCFRIIRSLSCPVP